MKRILALVALSMAFVAFWGTFLGAEAGAQQPTPGAGIPPGASVSKKFVKDEKGMVTWKLTPVVDANYAVWDPSAKSCQAFGGASCGGIGSDGSEGAFVKGSPGQYLLVTQNASVKEKTCEAESEVEFVVEPGKNPDKTHKKTKASYKCSGASAMGWPLLALAFGGAVAAAWYVRKRQPWKR